MQHEFCCVYLIGGSWRTWKKEPNNNHIPYWDWSANKRIPLSTQVSFRLLRASLDIGLRHFLFLVWWFYFSFFFFFLVFHALWWPVWCGKGSQHPTHTILDTNTRSNKHVTTMSHELLIYWVEVNIYTAFWTLKMKCTQSWVLCTNDLPECEHKFFCYTSRTWQITFLNRVQ